MQIAQHSLDVLTVHLICVPSWKENTARPAHVADRKNADLRNRNTAGPAEAGQGAAEASHTGKSGEQRVPK